MNNIDFSKYNLKSTPSRKLIIEVLSSAISPMSADDIFLKAKAINNNINLSTIYRALDLFTSKHIINKILIENDGKYFYSLETKEHKHYFICKTCKEITTLDSCPFEEYEEKMEDDYGFKIMSHNFELYGICKKCLKENRNVI